MRFIIIILFKVFVDDLKFLGFFSMKQFFEVFTFYTADLCILQNSNRLQNVFWRKKSYWLYIYIGVLVRVLFVRTYQGEVIYSFISALIILLLFPCYVTHAFMTGEQYAAKIIK